MTKRKTAYGEMLLIAMVVILLDQLTKYLIRTHLQFREVWAPIPALEDIFRFIYWKNTGVAFGLFQDNGWILTLLGIGVVLYIILTSKHVVDGSAYWRAALAMELGGAIGNLIDRINPNLGYVVDFIWVGNFPVFNVADMAIVIGAFVMLIGMLWEEKQMKKAADAAEGEKNNE